MSGPIRTPEQMIPLTHLTYHVLLALANAPLHGYGIIKEIESSTSGDLELETGTLYAAIKRMKEEGLLEHAKASAAAGIDSRRRYYALTPFGRSVLLLESQRLVRLLVVAQQKQIVQDLGLAPSK